MIQPSGDQFEISAAGYRAVITQSGAALRVLQHEGRDLIDGFGADEMAPGGRGQVLIPWPNRIRDGKYTFEGAEQQLALTEPKFHNASHGLVRWATWTCLTHQRDSVTMAAHLMAQTGYPWSLELQLTYALGAQGLILTHRVTNLSDTTAPYAAGMHPYLRAGESPFNTWVLTLPASTRVATDERNLPTGIEPVEDSPFDFRTPRALGETVMDTAFLDLHRTQGRAVVTLDDPAGTGVALWVDEAHDCLQLFTGDGAAVRPRQSLAVEPMTAPADAFNSGVHLIRLAPGQEFAASWGIAAR